MIDQIRYGLLRLIDWKISLLKKFRMVISGEYKYVVSDTKWINKHKEWKKQND
jgi:hypothetical protein